MILRDRICKQNKGGCDKNSGVYILLTLNENNHFVITASCAEKCVLRKNNRSGSWESYASGIIGATSRDGPTTYKCPYLGSAYYKCCCLLFHDVSLYPQTITSYFPTNMNFAADHQDEYHIDCDAVWVWVYFDSCVKVTIKTTINLML